jgi:hypothetical protein
MASAITIVKKRINRRWCGIYLQSTGVATLLQQSLGGSGKEVGHLEPWDPDHSSKKKGSRSALARQGRPAWRPCAGLAAAGSLPWRLACRHPVGRRRPETGSGGEDLYAGRRAAIGVHPDLPSRWWLGLVAGMAGILKGEAVYGVEGSAAEADVPRGGEGERGGYRAGMVCTSRDSVRIEGEGECGPPLHVAVPCCRHGADRVA